jgi:hypothetical protein
MFDLPEMNDFSMESHRDKGATRSILLALLNGNCDRSMLSVENESQVFHPSYCTFEQDFELIGVALSEYR